MMNLIAVFKSFTIMARLEYWYRPTLPSVKYDDLSQKINPNFWTPWNVTPSPEAHQQNAIKMAFHWRADGGPLRILVRTPCPLCKI